MAFFWEQFTGNDGDPPNPAEWTLESGSPDIQNNTLEVTSVSGAIERVSSKRTFTGDFTAQIRYDITTTDPQTTPNGFRVAFGIYIDATHYLYVVASSTASSRYWTHVWNDGSGEAQYGTTGRNYDNGGFKITRTGNVFKVYVRLTPTTHTWTEKTGTAGHNIVGSVGDVATIFFEVEDYWGTGLAVPTTSRFDNFIINITSYTKRFYCGPLYTGSWAYPDYSGLQWKFRYIYDSITLDYCDRTTTTYIHFVDGATVGVGQSFNSGVGGVLRHARFYIASIGGTQEITLKVYSHSGVYGTSSVPGVLLATSDPVSGSFSAGFAPFIFTGVNQITLTPSTYYVLVAECRGGGASYQEINYRPSGGHGGNAMTLDDTTELWTPDPTIDIPFGVFTVTATEPIVGETVTFADGSVVLIQQIEMWNAFIAATPYDFCMVWYEYVSGSAPIRVGTTFVCDTTGVTGTLVIDSDAYDRSYWNDHGNVYTNYEIDITQDPEVGNGFWIDYRDSIWGMPVAVNFEDPENSYIDANWDAYDELPPGWDTGSHIFDNEGITWTVVLPSDLATRQLYLYPEPPLESTKIYYSKEDILYWYPAFEWYPELAGAGSVPYTVDSVDPDVIWNISTALGATADGVGYSAYSIVTEVGEDDHAAWIKIRPVLAADPYSDGHDWDQVRVCAAQAIEVGTLSGGGSRAYMVVMPRPSTPEPSITKTSGQVIW